MESGPPLKLRTFAKCKSKTLHAHFVWPFELWQPIKEIAYVADPSQLQICHRRKRACGPGSVDLVTDAHVRQVMADIQHIEIYLTTNNVCH